MILRAVVLLSYVAERDGVGVVAVAQEDLHFLRGVPLGLVDDLHGVLQPRGLVDAALAHRVRALPQLLQHNNTLLRAEQSSKPPLTSLNSYSSKMEQGRAPGMP